METLLFSSHGTNIPEQAINKINPTVFRVTVFPPVLGPVITKEVKSLPIDISIGTTVSLAIKG